MKTDVEKDCNLLIISTGAECSDSSMLQSGWVWNEKLGVYSKTTRNIEQMVEYASEPI